MKLNAFALLLWTFVFSILILGAVGVLIVYECQFGGPKGPQGNKGPQGAAAPSIPITHLTVSSLSTTGLFSLASGPVVFQVNDYTKMVTASFVLSALVVIPANTNLPLLTLSFRAPLFSTTTAIGCATNTSEALLRPANVFYIPGETSNIQIQTPDNWSPNDRIQVQIMLLYGS
jgi:hypothetical protein